MLSIDVNIFLIGLEMSVNHAVEIKYKNIGCHESPGAVHFLAYLLKSLDTYTLFYLTPPEYLFRVLQITPS